MPTDWHDINDPGFRHSAEPEAEAPEQAEPTEESAKPADPEVELSNPRFIEPQFGFQANKPCKMAVDTAFIKKTIRKRVLFDVFSQYRDTDSVCKEYTGLEGFINDNGVAVAEMPYLPINADYSRHRKPNAETSYAVWFVAKHSRGTREVTSGELVLPPQPDIVFEFEINPEDRCARNDAFVLRGDDGYDSRKVIGDDMIAGDDYLTIGFSGLRPGVTYALYHCDGQSEILVREGISSG